MRRQIAVGVLLGLVFLFHGCGVRKPENTPSGTSSTEVPTEAASESTAAPGEDVATQEEAIVVNSTCYGGFEQVGSLPQDFARDDVQMITDPGDLVLYSGNQLVVFFGSNSWSYTKLGHIHLSVEELAELLDRDAVVLEIKLQ